MAARRVAGDRVQRQRIQRRERGFKRPEIRRIAEENGYQVVSSVILPDDREKLEEEMRRIADGNLADLILTTGGTGFSPRDWTPEATLAVSERIVPGIPEAMRAYSMQFTRRSMLSRSAAGIRGRTLIVNLPAAPRQCGNVWNISSAAWTTGWTF